MQKNEEWPNGAYWGIVTVCILFILVMGIQRWLQQKPTRAAPTSFTAQAHAEISARTAERSRRTRTQILRDLVKNWRALGRPFPSSSARELYIALVQHHIRPKDMEMTRNEAGMLLNAQRVLMSGEGQFSP